MARRDTARHLPAKDDDEEGTKVGNRTVTLVYQWRTLNANGLEADLGKIRWLASSEESSARESLSDKQKLLEQTETEVGKAAGLAPVAGPARQGELPDKGTGNRS